MVANALSRSQNVELIAYMPLVVLPVEERYDTYLICVSDRRTRTKLNSVFSHSLYLHIKKLSARPWIRIGFAKLLPCADAEILARSLSPHCLQMLHSANEITVVNSNAIIDFPPELCSVDPNRLMR